MRNINHKFDNLPLMSVRGIDIFPRRISGLGCEESVLGCKGPGFGWERPGFGWKNGLTKLVEGWSVCFESVFCLMILRSEIEK